MSDLAKREEKILEFWKKEKIFEKSLAKPAPKGEFVFYDGPPFASGLPHYGHMLPGTIKDAIPRFRTMQGYRVPRQWGWDCHGLPVENLVEKELGLKAKRDIEEYGIKKFNEAARAHIMKDDAEWKRIIPRTGRWADMDLDYKTMDSPYTESVWWAFKKLYDKGLIYEGFKSLHYCPHCGTTLSNFEVAQGYKDIEDFAVTVKLPLEGEKDTYLLVWTTTPWTLPGNAAAAVKGDAQYVKVKIGNEFYIAAQALAPEGEVVQTLLGKELVGKKYLPPFDYFKEELHKHKTHAWKVYAGDFVTLEDGTGIVHIAPAFGADDLALSQKNKIPLIHHVTDEGKFNTQVKDFAGLSVKPKGNPKETDAKVVEHLKARGLLFKEEKVKHSYPHCWRCDTPLLNWAANSWFVNVQDVKKKLISQNASVSWVPEHVGKGRFGNGLESAPDWAISRSRYWGAPIPVWRHTKRKEIKVAGSIEEMLSMVRKSGNRYFVMRHGEALHNVKGLIESDGSPHYVLTEKGKEQVKASTGKLKAIDLIITSPIPRAKETAAILQKELGLPDAAVMVDERLREIGTGALNGRAIQEWRSFFGSFKNRFLKAPEGGETYMHARVRLGELLFEIEKRYTNKKIVFITHNGPAWLLMSVASRMSLAEAYTKEDDDGYLANAEVKELPFVPFPHNDNFELDLHRPYIDEIPMGNTIEGEWKRVPDVFDCWFESGSMPYASNHYPFEKKDFNPARLFGLLSKGYPADFIAEGLDQTRGWFYSLLVLGVALFGKAPYKTVIVNGLVLASDGQKMSKRLKNYPDLMEVIEKYGADSLRFYLLSSGAVRAEDLRFQEREIDEISKKLLMRLDNVRSFLELYAGSEEKFNPTHVLDRWVIARLNKLITETTAGYEKYELDLATRPLIEFIDDLSTWYVRRSRDRFKEEGEDKRQALGTLRHVLKTVAQVMAPSMPFFAEHLWGAVRGESDAESVHLSEWPQDGEVDDVLLSDMKKARELASKGLELRERAGIKVRQPLAALEIAQDLSDELKAIVMDEVNVKEIKVNPELKEERLDTELTAELKEEGTIRNLVRTIQAWRKEQGLTISDRPDYTLKVSGEDAAVAEKHKELLIEQTGLKSLTIEGE